MTATTGTVTFFAVAPGVVAGLVPWWLTGWEPGLSVAAWLQLVGGFLLLAGVATLVLSFVRFVTEGGGTPAPIAPTERLVIGGLYRYMRNPMYLAVVATIFGQGLILGRPVLVGYGAAVWFVVALFVRLYEEPVLSEQFGDEYADYRRSVPGWLPRLRPWNPGEDF